MRRPKNIELVSKAEALEMLTKFMRNPKLTANELLKLIAIKSAIFGWDKEDEQL